LANGQNGQKNWWAKKEGKKMEGQKDLGGKQRQDLEPKDHRC
jgi:hypothetical protein